LQPSELQNSCEMTWPVCVIGDVHTAWTNGLEGPMYAVYWCSI